MLQMPAFQLVLHSMDKGQRKDCVALERSSGELWILFDIFELGIEARTKHVSEVQKH